MLKLPPFGDGQRIGLFGGSFNPAHIGHYKVALFALQRLQLDWVWWLVTPQNPLKGTSETAAYAKRLAFTRKIARHPKFIVTDIENQMHAKYTAETVAQLKALAPKANFIWIMGADSLANLHRWHHWMDIVNDVPFAVLARPGYSIRALNGVASSRLSQRQIPAEAAAKTLDKPLPSWTFITMPLRKESSTAIRKSGKTRA
jgi:nicotinate-nucleotide adenylyltransferase